MQSIFDRASGLRIIVIGDLMLDHYIFGEANRLSPEAPVPVVFVDQDRWALGGAANVALNVKTFGALTEAIGVIGNDTAGERLSNIFSEQNILFDDCYRCPTVQTITKTRVVVRNQQLCRIDREQPAPSYGLNQDAFLSHIDSSLKNTDAIILSDYAKGTLTQSCVDEIFKLARKHSCFVAIDPKPKRILKFPGPDLMTPNALESLVLAGVENVRGQSIDWASICKKIYAKHQPKNLVITMGAKGMLIAKDGQMIRQIPTYAREVFDVSGAGDTAIAALTVALVAGEDLSSAAHFANTASGIVVAKRGTALATPAEILNFHRQNQKILTNE